MAIHSFLPFPYKHYGPLPDYFPSILQWPEIYCHFLFRTVIGTLTYKASFCHLLHEMRQRYPFTLLRRLTHTFTFTYCNPFAYKIKPLIFLVLSYIKHVFKILQGQSLKDEFGQIPNTMTSCYDRGGSTDVSPLCSCPSSWFCHKIHVCKM